MPGHLDAVEGGFGRHLLHDSTAQGFPLWVLGRECVCGKLPFLVVKPNGQMGMVQAPLWDLGNE